MQDNQTQIVGNLGQDPEYRENLVAFSVAIYMGKDKPKAWIKVKCWKGDVDLPQLKKGDRVFVLGRLGQTEAWISKVDNQAKAATVINADVVSLKPWVDRGGARSAQGGGGSYASDSPPVDDYDDF